MARGMIAEINYVHLLSKWNRRAEIRVLREDINKNS